MNYMMQQSIAPSTYRHMTAKLPMDKKIITVFEYGFSEYSIYYKTLDSLIKHGCSNCQESKAALKKRKPLELFIQHRKSCGHTDRILSRLCPPSTLHFTTSRNL